jgi:hypothetical protein
VLLCFPATTSVSRACFLLLSKAMLIAVQIQPVKKVIQIIKICESF